MILSAPQIPEYAQIELSDSRLHLAAVNRIHFYDGIVDVNYDALAGQSENNCLTPVEGVALALGAIGMSYAQAGQAVLKGEDTIRTQSKSAYRKLGADGPHAKVFAIARAFDAGFFSVHRSIEPPDTAIRHANIVRHRATGQPSTTFQDKLDGTTTTRKQGLDRLTKLIQLKDGRQVQALVFYGYLTGIVQAEPYVPFESPKTRPDQAPIPIRLQPLVQTPALSA